jgi:tight adherence protein B
LYQQAFLAALGSTALFAVALVRRFRAERRNAIIEPRLRTIVKSTLMANSVIEPLRKPLPQRTALPAVLMSRLDSALAATGNRIVLPHLVATSIIASVIIGLAAAIVQSSLALSIALAGTAAVGTPALLLKFLQARNQRRFLNIFPDALDLMVRGVKAGLPLIEATELAAREIGAPVGIEFERILGEIRIGVEMEEALQHASDRIRVPDFRFFVVSLLLHRRTGGSIAEALSTLSTLIRQRKALRIKVRALTAEATASAAFIAALPFVAGIGLFLINREVMSALFVDARGRFMLGFAVVAQIVGIAVMKTMIKKSLT